MKIIEVHIQHFGALHNKRFSFTDGLNVLCENNGFGKSTLLGFIKAMFYGFFNTSAKTLESNDRKKYLPWDATSCGGSLTFEYDGGLYRIERTFGTSTKGDSLRVYDERLGKETEKFGDVPGEELFGIDAEGFLRSLALSERVFEEKEHESITDRLSSLVGTGGSMDGLEDGLACINAQIKELKRTGKRGEIDTIKREINTLEARIHFLTQEVDSIPQIRQELSECRELQQRLLSEKAKLETELRDDPTLGMESVKREELERKTKELEELSRSFLSGVPTLKEIERIQQCDGRYSQREVDEYKGLCCTFASFSEEALESQRRVYRRQMVLDTVPKTRDFYTDYPYMKETDDITEDEVKQYPQYNKRKLCRLTAIVLLLLSVVSLGLGLLASWLLAVGLVLLVFGIIAFVISPKSVLDKEKASRIAKIEAEAKPYGKTLLELWMKKAQYEEDLAREAEQKKECDELLRFLKQYGYTGEDVRDGFPYVERNWERYTALRQAGLANAEAEMAEVARFKTRYSSFGEPLYENIRIALLKKEGLERECEKLRTELSSPTLSQREFKEAQLKAIEDRLSTVQRSIFERNAQLERKEELFDEIEEKKAEVEELRVTNEQMEYRLRILEQTARMLERAKEAMQSSYLVPMRKNFDALLTTLSDKQAGEVYIDGSFKVSSRQDGTSRQMDAMSRGERDLYLLISRLAIVDTLYPEGMLPPIFLDDPFVAFDDGRTAKALEYLKSLGKKRQIIYLTCSEARTK